jgi:hypothetical protein
MSACICDSRILSRRKFRIVSRIRLSRLFGGSQQSDPRDRGQKEVRTVGEDVDQFMEVLVNDPGASLVEEEFSACGDGKGTLQLGLVA